MNIHVVHVQYQSRVEQNIHFISLIHIDICHWGFFTEKGYLASLMFSYYDKNMDNKIIRDELWEIWVTEPFQRMFASCSLMDMFRFENILDDEIQEEEFLKAFGKYSSIKNH